MKLLLSTCALLAIAAAAAQTPVQSSASSQAGVSAEAARNQAGASASSAEQINTQTAPTDQGKGDSKSGTAASSGAQAGISASSPAAETQAQVASGATIHAELSKSLDAKKLKEGQEVQARVTQDVRSGGRVIVPHGAKLIGHVTQASARSKSDSSSEARLGLIFDRAVLKNGEQVPVHAVIQALSAPPPLTSSYGDMSEAGAGADVGMGPSAGRGEMSQAGRGPGGAGPVQDIGQTAGGIAGNAGAQTAGTVGGVSAPVTGAAGSTVAANGVSGIKGLTLDTAAANSTQGSIITSRGDDVKLDSGTQLVLRVVTQ